MRFLYWARFLLEEGRPEAALAELEIAVKQMPENREAKQLLEETRAKLGR